MIELNLSFTITAIIALTSLISPWIANSINNRHQRKMKLLEYQQERYNKTVLYKREIFEKYISSIGKVVLSNSHENLSEYGKYYGLASLYVQDENLRNLMAETHESIVNYEYNTDHPKAFLNKVETVTHQISEILSTLE